MGQMYAWASPEYLLDYTTLEEVFFYYDKGVDFEEQKARLIIAKLEEALQDPKKRKEKAPRKDNDKPDKSKFYKYHGDKIERLQQKGGE